MTYEIYECKFPPKNPKSTTVNFQEVFMGYCNDLQNAFDVIYSDYPKLTNSTKQIVSSDKGWVVFITHRDVTGTHTYRFNIKAS